MWSRHVLHLALLSWTGCTLPAKDADSDTARSCPVSLESLCRYEFGGDCPSYVDMAAMTCVGYHFDPTGLAGVPPITSDGGYGCSQPSVSCVDEDDANLRSRFEFNATGVGHVVAADIIWPADDPCPADGVYGYTPC